MAHSDWQLNAPRSIRDIVRREKWATNFEKAIAEHQSDRDLVTLGDDKVTIVVTQFCVLVDS